MAMVMENQQPLAPMPAPPLPPPPSPPLPPPPQAYKHRCKVCKKGFMCGRALGGHMRAHGVTDDGLSADNALDDDDSGPCGGALDSSEAAAAAATTKRMYSLRTNAGRHKNCRVCENCGKEFTSWRSLLDHGRCNHDQEKDDLNIYGADIDGEDEEDLALAAGGWSKGKRTRRTKVIVVENGSSIDQQVPTTSREEEDLANCLVMLASSRGGVQPQDIVDVHQQPHESTSKDERASASKDDQQRFLVPPQPISMLPPTVPQFKFLAPPQVMPSPVVPRGLFECKACKKVFTSHQALGGHRASHKKVKGCFAAKLEESSRNDSPQRSAASTNDNIKVVVEAIPAIVDTTESANGVDGNAEAGIMVNARTTAVVAAATSAPEMAIMQVDEAPSSSTVSPFKKKGKVHECSICHRVFMSGQALGGHKRCHWLTTGAGDPTVVAKLQAFVPQDHVMHPMCQQLTLGTPMCDRTPDSCLDLNVLMNQSADPAATRQAAGRNESMLSLNAPASLYMHSWADASNMHVNTAATSGHYDLPEATATEDEADSTSSKRAKISDLKDMNMAGETSTWLQVGIAVPSETNERLLKPKG